MVRLNIRPLLKETTSLDLNKGTPNWSGGAPFWTCACVYNKEKMCPFHLYMYIGIYLVRRNILVQKHAFLACQNSSLSLVLE